MGLSRAVAIGLGLPRASRNLKRDDARRWLACLAHIRSDVWVSRNVRLADLWELLTAITCKSVSELGAPQAVERPCDAVRLAACALMPTRDSG